MLVAGRNGRERGLKSHYLSVYLRVYVPMLAATLTLVVLDGKAED